MPQGMRERRKYDGQELVFDARSVLDKRQHKGKVLMKMVQGPLSFGTGTGVTFWKEHPFQWVTEEEAQELDRIGTPAFVRANFEELEDYYAY